MKKEEKYEVDDLILKSALDKIKTSTNQKLYKYLAACLKNAKAENIAELF